MKVSRRIYGIALSIAIGSVMSVTMSFVMLWVQVGLVDGFLAMWAKVSLIGFTVAVPVSAVAVPAAMKVVGHFFEVSDG